ncbi:MAG: hypothetical protein CL493_00740 [Actinobacteria bacterium]|nr:hypothetical protein [Actinomycetota bacterium]
MNLLKFGKSSKLRLFYIELECNHANKTFNNCFSFDRFTYTCCLWCVAVNILKLRNFNLEHGITHIPLELPWSSPGFVNVYFIEDSNGLIMIDCGVDGNEYLKLLESKMDSFGITFEDIKLLIGTHMHSDHIGLSTTIREKNIPFALYKNSVDFIEGYNDWSIRFKQLKEYARNEGAPKSFLDDLDQIETPKYAGKLSNPEILLDEGKLKEVNRNIEVIFTPGHDRTEISILDNPSKILFSGDHILPKITPFIPLEDAEDDMLQKYTSSLDKVYNLEQKLIAPGHGSLIEKPYLRIEQMKLHHKRRSEKIIKLIGNSQLSGWEIVSLLFPRKLDALNLRLAFQETMAHLKYLENNKKIIHIVNSKVNLWEIAKQA